jgi:hypothetical protein
LPRKVASVSTRTVMPATTVANHMKVLTREKAGRSNWIAFHQQPHSDSGRPRSNMAPPALALVRGPLLRTSDSQFVNHAGVHDRDTKKTHQNAARAAIPPGNRNLWPALACCVRLKAGPLTRPRPSTMSARQGPGFSPPACLHLERRRCGPHWFRAWGVPAHLTPCGLRLLVERHSKGAGAFSRIERT